MTANPFRFLYRVAARLRDIDLARAASSLSFTTLLAIVPLVTVAFSFVARFPDVRGLAEGARAVPAAASAAVRGRGADSRPYRRRSPSRRRALTGLSILAIAVSAALALATVEREINAIWGIRRGRSLPKRVIVYAIGLTAGPVLLGASISITTWLVVHSLAAVSIRKTLGTPIVEALPFLFSTAGLTLLYKGVPARRVAVCRHSSPVRWPRAHSRRRSTGSRGT